MGISTKIIKALNDEMQVEFVRLHDDDGVTGFVVSPRFRAMTSLDRQTFIDHALSRSLSTAEQRQVLMIAAITPEEYQTVGAPIRVHRVRETKSGALKFLLNGKVADARYVRKVLRSQQGIRATRPRQSMGSRGILTSFKARPASSHPLTKADAIRILKNDKYIEVMPNA